VFHSIVMQYLPADERARFEEAVERGSGTRAWLRMEPGGENLTEIRLKLWPGGEDRLLARAGYHGDFVNWLG
jgi:hypothetical protein